MFASKLIFEIFYFHRMNAEVEKSNSKLSKLEAEFGVEMMTAWKTEHAAEVLTPQQMKQLGISDQS